MSHCCESDRVLLCEWDGTLQTQFISVSAVFVYCSQLFSIVPKIKTHR